MPVELHCQEIGEVWVLVMAANGAPVVMRRLLGRSRALDFGLHWPDRRRLFGPTKTIRGAFSAIAAATLAAPLLGLNWSLGLAAGAAAMAGDLMSSFLKRRLDIAPSGRATGLDQIPESLLPALACAGPLGLNTLDVATVTLGFFATEILLSTALYALRLRRRPY